MTNLRPVFFLPLAFLAGAHGFVYLAPYLAFIAALDACRRHRRTPRGAPITRSV